MADNGVGNDTNSDKKPPQKRLRDVEERNMQKGNGQIDVDGMDTATELN